MKSEKQELVNEIIKTLLSRFPEDLYCGNCGELVIDDETSHLVEYYRGGYCEICECENPLIDLEKLKNKYSDLV